MTRFLEFTGKLWPLFATLGLIGSVVWYFANLDGRVRELEQRVHTLTVAPVIADQSSAAAPSGQAPASIINPVAQACADLATRAATQASNGSFVSESSIRTLMQELGCMTQQGVYYDDSSSSDAGRKRPQPKSR
jgi:hypothetical protein